MKTQLLMAAIAAAVSMTAFGVDEITAMNQLNVNKGYLSIAKRVESKETLYGAVYEQKVTAFDTNASNKLALSPSITTPGVAFLRNLTTNCSAVVTATFELFPGETVMGRLLSTNVSVYASTNPLIGVTYGVITNVSGITTNIWTNTLPTSVTVESLILAQ
jgi:hypothetical protein